MKRYLLFAGDSYYPEGGWFDFKGDFDTVVDAIKSIALRDYDWYHVVDSTTQKRV